MTAVNTVAMVAPAPAPARAAQPAGGDDFARELAAAEAGADRGRVGEREARRPGDAGRSRTADHDRTTRGDAASAATGDATSPDTLSAAQGTTDSGASSPATAALDDEGYLGESLPDDVIAALVAAGAAPSTDAATPTEQPADASTQAPAEAVTGAAAGVVATDEAANTAGATSPAQPTPATVATTAASAPAASGATATTAVPSADTAAPAASQAAAPTVAAEAQSGEQGQSGEDQTSREQPQPGPQAATVSPTRAESAVPTGTPSAIAEPVAPAPATTGPAPLPAGMEAVATTAPAQSVSTAAAPAAPNAPAFQFPTPLASQLGSQLTQLNQLPQGEHRLTLTVNPETFGPVKVVATIGADRVSIEIVGASEQARAALRQALPDLRRDLAGAGLDSDLQLGGDEPSGRGQETFDDRGGFGRGGTAPTPLATPVPAAAPSGPSSIPQTATSRDGVDLIL